MYFETPEFLSDKDLQQYIEAEKIQTLKTLSNRAKDSNLINKYLYKDFKGLFLQGNTDLFLQPKIAIIGTRSPNQYTKQITAHLSSMLAQNNFSIVSGGAIGIDCIAHISSKEKSILVLPCGISTLYPKENAHMINYIREQGLVLSEYEGSKTPFKHSFLERNRLIIALSDIIIIPQADCKSGSSSSANLAVLLKKELYVLPHRLNESLATQVLLKNNHAQCIYNLESFLQDMILKFNLNTKVSTDDPLLIFAQNHGLFEEALELFGNQVFAYELEGKIKRNGLYIESC